MFVVTYCISVFLDCFLFGNLEILRGSSTNGKGNPSTGERELDVTSFGDGNPDLLDNSSTFNGVSRQGKSFLPSAFYCCLLHVKVRICCLLTLKSYLPSTAAFYTLKSASAAF